MSQKTRKERQQELRAIERRKEDLENNASFEKTDELIFKEQKQRLRKQLNDVPVISIDATDTLVKPNRMQTRKEIKKQKKIDDILKDIAVLPEDKYLDEDTNLRILRNLSVHKQYNKLQLSPEQEEKMLENKERFDTITNQLWFLIKELDSKHVHEPDLGQVPTIASKNSNNIKARQERKFFDIEEELAETQASVDEALFAKMQPKKEFRDLSSNIEEKLSDIQLEEHGELTMVLEELDRIIQDDKKIVRKELETQTGHTGNIPPQDTMELLNLLQDLEDTKKGMGEIDLTGERRDIIAEANKIKKTSEIFVEAEMPVEQKQPEKTENIVTPEENEKAVQIVKKEDNRVTQTTTLEANAEKGQQKIVQEQQVSDQVHNDKKTKKAPASVQEKKLTKGIEIDLQKASQSTVKTAYKTIDLTQFTLETEDVQKELKKTDHTKQSTGKNQETKEKKQKPEKKSESKTKMGEKAESVEEVEVVERKKNKLQNSILVTAFIFIGLLIVFIIYVIYLIMTGQMTF